MCTHTDKIYTYIYLYIHILRCVFYIKQIKHYMCIYGWFTLLCCWKIAFAMTSGFSWQNSVSLCPASFCTLRLNLPVMTGISWLPTSAFQPPMMKRTSFWVLFLQGLVCLHRNVQLQILQHSSLGHILGLLSYWTVCPGNEWRAFCHFWDHTQALNLGLFCWLWGLLHFFQGILANTSRCNGHLN